MGILDDAIREHLDLKRKHGAHDADLREIEDEAFGSTDRPDPFASNELFNEVASSGEPGSQASGAATAEPGALGDLEAPGGLTEPDAGGEDPTRLVEPDALRPAEPSFEEPASEPLSPPEGVEQIPGQVELPGQDEIPGQETLDDPLEGYQPPAEPETASEPHLTEPEEAPESSSHSESLEDLIAAEEPFPEDEGAAPAAGPSELPYDPGAPPPPAAEDAAAEADSEEEPEPGPEPESSVPEPPPPPPPSAEPPGRARGRIDVPTQEHPPPGETGGLPPLPPEGEPEPLEPASEAPAAEPYAEEPADDSEAPALYDFETDEDPLVSEPAPADDDFEALGPAEEEAPYLEEEEPYAEEPVSGTEPPPEEPGTEVRPALEDEEVYEGGGPDPEESYEEEEGEEGLWFEKGPPKDFDFDD